MRGISPKNLGVGPGDIFYTSGGEHLSIHTFYEVMACTPTSVKVQEILSEVVSGSINKDTMLIGPGRKRVSPEESHRIKLIDGVPAFESCMGTAYKISNPSEFKVLTDSWGFLD